MTDYERLLTEKSAHRIVLYEQAYTWGSDSFTLRCSTEPVPTTISTNKYLPLLQTTFDGLNSSATLMGGDTYGGLGGFGSGVVEILNPGGYLSYEGLVINLDDAASWRIHDLSFKILIVGTLADGTVVTRDTAAATPYLAGVGVGMPDRSQRTIRFAYTLGNSGLSRVLNQRPFAPECLEFPGNAAVYLNFGDPLGSVLDPTGDFTIQGWIYAYEPSRANQILYSKDLGATNGIRLYLSGGELSFLVRNQSPDTTTTSGAGTTILPNIWYHVAFTWSAGSARRDILVNGVSVANTTSITGGSAPDVSATLQFGSNFWGRLSVWKRYSVAKSAAAIRSLMFIKSDDTVAGVYTYTVESDLANLFGFSEGRLRTTYEAAVNYPLIKSDLLDGVEWVPSGWCSASLVGKKWPAVIGKARAVTLPPIDPSNPAGPMFGTAWPPPLIQPTVYASHLALTPTTQYTWESTFGTITLVGSPLGLYMGDLCGETMFNRAVTFDGTTGYATGASTCPQNSLSFAMLFRPSTKASTTKIIAGWRSGAAGDRYFSLSDAGANILTFTVRNNAGTAYTVSSVLSLNANQWYAIAATLDTSNSQLKLYIDGELIATTAIAGSWTTVHTTFMVARDNTAQWYFDGAIDHMVIMSSVMPLTASGSDVSVQLSALVPWAGLTGVSHKYYCDESSGSTLNDIGGGTNLTLSGGYTRIQSRIALADIIRTILSEYVGVLLPLGHYLDYASCCQHLRDSRSADCGVMIEDDRSIGEHLDWLLRGTGSTLKQGPTSATFPGGTLLLEQVALPTGAPDTGADFSMSHLSIPAESARGSLRAPITRVLLGFARNYSPQNGDQLAGLLTEAGGAQYQFGTNEWRYARATNPDGQDDFAEPEPLFVETPYLNEADAELEADRVLALYDPDVEGLLFTFLYPVEPFVSLNGEFRITLEEGSPAYQRLDCGSPGRCFRVLSLQKQGPNIIVVGLAEPVQVRVTGTGSLRGVDDGTRRGV